MLKKLGTFLLFLTVTFNGWVAYSIVTHPEFDGYLILDVPADKYDRLFTAIAQVESNHDPRAFNQKEGARGILQITPIMVDEVNRIVGEQRYLIEDCFSIFKSKQMFRIYCEHWFPGGTLEQWARAWNGGPTGPHKSSTKGYWAKVNSVLQSTN